MSNFLDVGRPPSYSLGTGCLPRNDVCGAEMPIYEKEFGVYPRSEWDRIDSENNSLEEVITYLHNQKSEGSCASNAASCAFETCWNMTLGKDASVPMSPIALYRFLARGPGSGSTISGNIKRLTEVGSLPVDTPENRAALEAMGLDPNHVLQHVGYYQTFPSGWEETAKYFQCAESFDIGSFDGLVSAVWDDFAVEYGRAGHAICAVDAVKRNGVWCIKYQNSWGNWGERGSNGLQAYGYDTESYVSSSIRSYGAFAVRSIKVTDPVLRLREHLKAA